jgi:hypothetical protein
MSGQDDDFTSNVPRYKVLFQARRAFRELYFDAMREVKGVAIELSPQLTIPLPQDFVDYARISWLDAKGVLHPMAKNNKMSIAKEYLQGSDYQLLFDDGGNLIQSSDTNIAKYGEVGTLPSSNSGVFNPNKNLSEAFENGSYMVDKSEGLIKFGSEVYGKVVVLEYISDGLFTDSSGGSDLKIHQFAESAVYDFIYWKLVERRIHVPANEKARARKEWFGSRRKTKKKMNPIKADELRQVFKGASQWVKGS